MPPCIYVMLYADLSAHRLRC